MKIFEKFDKTLMVVLFMLICAGVLMVLSASPLFAYKRFNAPYNFFIKQLIWVAVGMFFLFLTVHLDGSVVRRFIRIAFWAWTFVLLLLLFFGKEVNGAKRWIDIGFINFQPAEFMKVFLIIYLADYIDRRKSRLTRPKYFMRLLLLLAMPLGLIALQPDLGSIFVMMMIIIAMFFLGGIKSKYIAILISICAMVVAVEVARYPYRMARFNQYAKIITGKDIFPQAKNKKTSTQQENAIKALESGGWFGAGPGNSTLKLFYLPEPHTDFIFSIIGEEFGFLGALFVAGLFFMIFFRSYQIARVSTDLYSYLLVSGLAFFLSFQAFFHIGVSCGMLPTKGLTLPFISFGGSSLVAAMITAGFLLKHSVRLSSR